MSEEATKIISKLIDYIEINKLEEYFKLHSINYINLIAENSGDKCAKTLTNLFVKCRLGLERLHIDWYFIFVKQFRLRFKFYPNKFYINKKIMLDMEKYHNDFYNYLDYMGLLENYECYNKSSSTLIFNITLMDFIGIYSKFKDNYDSIMQELTKYNKIMALMDYADVSGILDHVIIPKIELD